MIDYTIKKSVRAKHLRITIQPDGSVVVTIPKRGSFESGEKFAQEKKDWIERKVKEIKARKASLSAPVLPKGTKKDLEKYKRAALSLIQERLVHFNQVYRFTWKKITIKNLKTRWGSCSKKGNLNFSYKILYLSHELADYLVVHELCHLGEFNHSKQFWKLVEKAIPDYAIRRKQLRGLD